MVEQAIHPHKFYFALAKYIGDRVVIYLHTTSVVDGELVTVGDDYLLVTSSHTHNTCIVPFTAISTVTPWEPSK